MRWAGRIMLKYPVVDNSDIPAVKAGFGYQYLDSNSPSFVVRTPDDTTLNDHASVPSPATFGFLIRRAVA